MLGDRENADHVLKHAGRMREQLETIEEAMETGEPDSEDFRLAADYLTKVNHRSAALATAIHRALDRRNLRQEAADADWDEALKEWSREYGTAAHQTDQTDEMNETEEIEGIRGETMTQDTTTIEQEIRQAFANAIANRAAMEENAETMREIEEDEKLMEDHYSEYTSAKNNEIRQLMLASWLRENEAWVGAREGYRKARRDLRSTMLRIESLKLLVAAGAGSGSGE